MLRLLIIGDSSAAGVGVASQSDALLGQTLEQLCKSFTVSYDLVAQTGARTGDALGWINDAPARTYDVVICALGANDVVKGTRLNRFIARYAALLTRLQLHCKAQVIIVTAIPPVAHFPALPQPLRWVLGRRARRFDAQLRNLVAAQAGCVSISFDRELDASAMASDGFHPGAGAYAMWGQTAAQVIRDQPLRLDGKAVGP